LDHLLILLISAIAIILVAYALSTDIFAPLLAFIHEKFNEKYGFPRNVKTGKEGLIGKTAIVKTAFIKDPEKELYRGKVSLNAELWNAVISIEEGRTLAANEKVEIVGINGITLKIKPFA